MRIAIIGTGLIGGSLSLTLRAKGLATYVTGVEQNESHAKRALELGLVDEIASLTAAVQQSDLIVLAIPINAAEAMLPGILDQIDKQVVMDVGSTKKIICESVANHPKRGRFVATHPMWGTEYSGPDAAVKTAFTDKATVICSKEESDADAVELVEVSTKHWVCTCCT